MPHERGSLRRAVLRPIPPTVDNVMTFRRALLFLLLILVPALAVLPAAAVEIGETAPDFLTEDLQSSVPITISGHDNQVVVLVFFWTS
jgi:hypothetical protein